MRRLSLSLDALPALRDATSAADAGLTAAATLAGLAGADALRLGVAEELRPVREEDVAELRRVAPVLELRMAPLQGLVKVALEARPDRVVLGSGGREGPGSASALDLRVRDATLGAVLRSLEEAGLPSVLVVPPALEAVKAAHALGASGVELFTGATVDLPPGERRAQLEALGDAVRLAAKLRLEIGLGGGLGYRSLPEVLAAAPAADRVVVGRAVWMRSLLVGLDRALRDVRALVDAAR